MSDVAANIPTSSSVPAPICGLLIRLIRRARIMAVLRGVLATAAVGGGSLLAIMAVDASVAIESAWPRWAMSLSALTLTIATLIAMVILPLAKSRGLTWAARVIEARHPELQERLSSAVELLTSVDSPELRGSEALVRALAEQASGDAISLRPGREISLRRVLPYLAAAGACAVAMAAVMLFWPDQARLLLARAVAPQTEPGNILAWQIRIINPPGGDATIASDESLSIGVELAEGAGDSANVRVRPVDAAAGGTIDLADGGKMTFVGRSPQGLPRFSLTIPPTAKSFAYHIRSGRAVSAEHFITVIDRPRVIRLDARYDYPAYTGLASKTQEVVDGKIRAISGTRIALLVRLNKPVASVRPVDSGGRAQAVALQMRTEADGAATCEMDFVLSAGVVQRRTLVFHDSAGLTSEPCELELIAEPDNPPTVRLVEPADSAMRMRPDDRLSLAWLAADDVGLSRIDILLEADGRDLPGVSLFDSAKASTRPATGPAADQLKKSLSGRSVLDLGAMDLRGTGRLKVKIRALDNLPADQSGPQEGFSGTLTVILDSATPWLAQQTILAEELRIRQVLQAALQELQSAKRDSDPLRNEAGTTGDLARQAMARADRIRERCSKVDSDLRSLSGQLAGGTYDSWAVRLQSLSDEHVGRAAILVGQIAQAQRPDNRADLADETDFQVERSIQIVTDMLAELGVLTELAIRATELREMMHREEELAEEKAKQEQLAAGSQSASQPDQAASQSSSQPAGDNQMSASQWKQEQQALADRLGQMARDRENQKSKQSQLSQPQKKPENQPPAEEDIASELRKAARKQNELVADTARLAELKAAEDELANLAAQQKALSDETGKEKPAASLQPKMSAAADDIRAGKLASALAGQQDSQDQLSKTAKQLKDNKDLAELAKKVAQLAKSQTDLAGSAKQAAAENATAKQSARQAAEKEKQSAKEVQDAKQKLDKAAEIEKAAVEQAGKKVAKTSQDVKDAKQKLDQALAAASAASQPAGESASKPTSQSANPNADRMAKDVQDARRKLDEAVAAEKSAQQESAAAGDNKDRKAAADSLEKARASHAADQSAQAKADQTAAQTKQKLDDLARRQQELASQAENIKDSLAKTPGGSSAAKTNPLDAMKKAAQALSGQDSNSAAKLAEEAAAQTGKTATELKDAVDKADPERAPAIEKLAERQAELKKKTQDAAARRDSLQQQIQASQAKRLADRQQALAGDAAKLADEVKKTAAQEDRIETAAARNAQQAAKQSAAGVNDQAAKNANQAAKQLKDLAGRLGAGETKTAATKSASAPSPAGQQVRASQTLEEQAETPRQALAKKAAELAGRQAELAGQLDSLAKRQPAQVAAKEQAAVAERTAKVNKDVKNLQDHAEGLIADPEAKKDLDKAVELVDKAGRQQTEASQAIDKGQPAEAGKSQQSSAKALSDAADSLEKMGQKLAKNAADSGDQDEQFDQAMNEAQEAAQEAAMSQAAKDAQKAAKQLAKLSRVADSQAKMAGLNTEESEGMMSSLDPSGGSTGLTPEQTAEALKTLGVSYEDWARLPGRLKEEVLQAAQADGPPEYRDLIRKYFQEIARRAGQKNGGGK